METVWSLLASVVYGFFLITLALIVTILLYKLYPRGRIAITPKFSVFISGCDSGFGYEIAKQLDSLGFTVFAGCLQKDGLGAKKLKSECTSNLNVVSLDVTSDESVKAASNYVQENLPDKKLGLWAVICNAGIWTWGEVEWCRIDTYKRIAEVNVYGIVRTVQAFLPMIRKAKGRVVNISSISGIWTTPSNSAYCMTKYAIESFSDALRYEMRPFRIKVVLVEPGQYARATSIGQSTDERFQQTSKELWDGMSQVAKRDYGKADFDAHMRAFDGFRRENSADATPVIQAMVAAVTDRHPKARYLVGPFYDTHVVAYLSRFSPSFIMDSIITKHRRLFPKPLALQ